MAGSEKAPSTSRQDASIRPMSFGSGEHGDPSDVLTTSIDGEGESVQKKVHCGSSSVRIRHKRDVLLHRGGASGPGPAAIPFQLMRRDGVQRPCANQSGSQGSA
jgi:hypothetical protein